MPIIHSRPITVPTPPKIEDLYVVFDLDDTLWPQLARAFRNTPYSIDMMDTFSITENKVFSTEDAIKILKLFEDPANFTDIEFYPAVRKIEFLHNLGVRIDINTTSLSEAVAEVKLPQLRRAFPYLDEKSFILTVKGHDRVATGKQIDETVTFFVDDNPLNIVKSKAYIDLVPAQPYNCSPGEIRRMKKRHYYLMKNLDVILDTILLSVKSWQFQHRRRS